LDDPLSAVDSHVGKHLFNHAICDLLAGKTRLLVTHQIQFLSAPEVSCVHVMKHGKFEGTGTYAELTAQRLLEYVGKGGQREEEERQDSQDVTPDLDVPPVGGSIRAVESTTSLASAISEGSENQSPNNLSALDSGTDNTATATNNDEKPDDNETGGGPSSILAVEDREAGEVSIPLTPIMCSVWEAQECYSF
jgi:hypothetical protein